MASSIFPLAVITGTGMGFSARRHDAEVDTIHFLSFTSVDDVIHSLFSFFRWLIMSSLASARLTLYPILGKFFLKVVADHLVMSMMKPLARRRSPSGPDFLVVLRRGCDPSFLLGPQVWMFSLTGVSLSGRADDLETVYLEADDLFRELVISRLGCSPGRPVLRAIP